MEFKFYEYSKFWETTARLTFTEEGIEVFSRLQPAEIKAFMMLAKKMNDGGFFHLNSVSLASAMGMSRQTAMAVMEELITKSLVIPTDKKVGRDRVYLINPVYAWRGDGTASKIVRGELIRQFNHELGRQTLLSKEDAMDLHFKQYMKFQRSSFASIASETSEELAHDKA